MTGYNKYYDPRDIVVLLILLLITIFVSRFLINLMLLWVRRG